MNTMKARVPSWFGVVLLVGTASCGSSSSDGPSSGGGGAAGGGAGGAGAGIGGGGLSGEAGANAAGAGAGGAGSNAGANPGGAGAGGGAGGGSSGAGGAVPACACDAGATKPCSDLAKLYAPDAKAATCKPDCTGWDVSACSFDASGTKSEYVYPAKRDPRFASARCNDGTPFWFRVSLTGSRRWVIFFEGGGACDGKQIPCQLRLAASPPLFSSSADPADGTVDKMPVKEDGILSRDPKVNPTFADANMVIGDYCSSDLWSGVGTTPVHGDVKFDLLFAGRLNARAMMQTLAERYGMDDAKDIDLVVTGSSAGGNGARNNTDLFADAFPKARAASRMWSLPVAGFQIDQWSFPGAGVMGSNLDDPTSWKQISAQWTSEPNAKCQALAAAEGRGPSACLPGVLATRSLVLPEPAGYGLRVLDATNRSDPVYLRYHAVDPSLPNYKAIVDQWEPIVTSEMLASGVRWLLAPAHRGTPNVHGLYPFWTTPFPAYDATKDPCKSPWPAGITTFRDLVTAFYVDKEPATSGVKVCPFDNWPP